MQVGPSFEHRPSKCAAHAQPQIVDVLSKDEVVGSLNTEEDGNHDDSDGESVAWAYFGDSNSVPCSMSEAMRKIDNKDWKAAAQTILMQTWTMKPGFLALAFR